MIELHLLGVTTLCNICTCRHTHRQADNKVQIYLIHFHGLVCEHTNFELYTLKD